MRMPLSQGVCYWQETLKKVSKLEGDRFCLLEFVMNDLVSQMKDDAKTLNEIIERSLIL